MTAEIAIMNKIAVALAADSKVTIGSSSKTFDTVNKVFTLSKVHPIGLMIFGNAEFMRYPWETIVKIYRSQKGGKSHATVEQWGLDFVRYIGRFVKVDAHERNENVNSVVISVFSRARRDALDIARVRKIPATSPDFKQIVKDCLKSLIAGVSSDEFFTDTYMSSFKGQFGKTISDIIDYYSGDIHDVTIKKLANEYIYKLIKSSSFSPYSSGIVIAGFGDNNVFPSLVCYETDGYLGKNNKIKLGGKIAITRDNASCIVPFAQREMVERFMEGIDPRYAEFLRGIAQKVMTDNCLSVLNKYGDKNNKNRKVERSIENAVLQSLKIHQKVIDVFKGEYYTRPIISMVSLLPKDELPHLAESLVALTSLKRHVSHDPETVGGPIDVALISKSDGFVWIKRKHYFRAELNRQFFANYRRDVEHGGANVSPRNNSSNRRGTKAKATNNSTKKS
jgi:hypothetical protein